jgi:hypothetical protein
MNTSKDPVSVFDPTSIRAPRWPELITGRDAIAYAACTGAKLRKYADPIEGERVVSVEEGLRIAVEDASLLWTRRQAEIDFSTPLRHAVSDTYVFLRAIEHGDNVSSLLKTAEARGFFELCRAGRVTLRTTGCVWRVLFDGRICAKICIGECEFVLLKGDDREIADDIECEIVLPTVEVAST